MNVSPSQMRLLFSQDDKALIQLSGDWTMFSGIADVAKLLNRIQTNKIDTICFETSRLGDWDSALLTWVMALVEYCEKHSITLDRSGLPDGVNRLLRLAQAVPERSDIRHQVESSSFLSKVGEDFFDAVQTTGEFIEFFGASLLALYKLASGKAVYRTSDLWLIMQNAGVRALPIISLVSFLVGLILGFVGAVQLQNFGAGIYIANLVGIAMTREMAAIMTGIIMAGRTGAAYAAEIGSMQVNEEVDALETSGFSAMEFLVLPRMIALMLMMPLLAVYADLMGIVGGALVAVSVLDLSFTEYSNQILKVVTLNDFFVGLFMALVFGVIVAVVGCLRGMQCGRSSQAVGLATTSAVVSAMVMIVVACAVLTVLYNALGI